MELIESTDHQLSIALIDLALETVHLREEDFEMHQWNVSIKYLNTHLNYSVVLMYSATPLTQTPKGNKKLWKLNVVCVLLIIHLRNNVFTFPAQSIVIFVHLDCFRRVFLQVMFSQAIRISFSWMSSCSPMFWQFDIIINQHFFSKFELLGWIWGKGKSN